MCGRVRVHVLVLKLPEGGREVGNILEDAAVVREYVHELVEGYAAAVDTPHTA